MSEVKDGGPFEFFRFADPDGDVITIFSVEEASKTVE